MATSVTITQIAETAGVSTATVDRVLNNRPGVNPATVQRVREAMKGLGAAASRCPSPVSYTHLTLPTILLV